MAVLARSGQRAAALAQFETCRRILAKELAVEPDGETLALMEAIRAGGFDKEIRRQGDRETVRAGHFANRKSEIVNSLPIPPTPLVGRERELADLSELIGNPVCRLLTITGSGGMGKTRSSLLELSEDEVYRHFVLPEAGALKMRAEQERSRAERLAAWEASHGLARSRGLSDMFMNPLPLLIPRINRTP